MVDWDDALAYPTVKVVAVKDRYLGCLRLFLLMAIFVYVVVNIIYGQKFLLTDLPPIGAVRPTLNRPEQDTTKFAPYCDQNITGDPFYFDIAHCQYWDTLDLLVPPPTPFSMFITTYQTTQEQSMSCYAGQCDDNSRNTSRSNSSYIADVDNYIVGMRHSFVSTGFDNLDRDAYAKSVNQMAGSLRKRNGDIIRNFGASDTDYLTLREVLEAAELRLDEPSDFVAKKPQSYRHLGVALVFVISYSNYNKWGDKTITYTYTVYRAPATSFNFNEITPISSIARLWRKRAGVQLIFIQTGRISKLDFQTTLVQLTSSMSLLAVATLVVEYAMLYAMPLRDKYKKAKFEETEDFSQFHKKNVNSEHGSNSGSNGATMTQPLIAGHSDSGSTSFDSKARV